MAHFYGEVRGRATSPATRLGTKQSGVRVLAAAKSGKAIEVRLWHEGGNDYYTIEFKDWPTTKVFWAIDGKLNQI